MDTFRQDELVLSAPASAPPAELYSGPVVQAALAPAPRPKVLRPALLFLATCITTTLVQGFSPGLGAYVRASQLASPPEALVVGLAALLAHGLPFSVPLMLILMSHELGHFVQARRYGVYCSLPHFIPIPLPPLGTMGAVIAMDPRVPNRRALFDIGAGGPLAGLAPTLIFLYVGISWSSYGPIIPTAERFGDPPLFRWIAEWIHGPAPAGHEIYAHPMAFAGWAGLLLTTINLIPLGQLDGGHVLYALLGRRANRVAHLLFVVIIAAMIIYWKYLFSYTLLIIVLALMRPTHPPTARDDVPLGPLRAVLACLILAFIPIGFTPTPFIMPK